MGHRRLLVALLLVGTVVVPAGGQHATYEAVTFSTTAIGFTATTIRPAGQPEMIFCSGVVEDAQIRVRSDGTDPTAAEGQPVEVGQQVCIWGLTHLSQFRGIRTGGTDGVVRFQCSRSAPPSC